MSRHGRRRPQPPQDNNKVARFRRKPHLRVVKDESREESEQFAGGSMSLAEDECPDDRPAASADAPGVLLRRARERRGLTLDALARTTKISKPMLTALEAADVLRLPAAIYTRGFVKAYAAEVGLDPERTADEYLKAIEPVATHHLLVDDGLLPPLASDADPAVDANDDARQMLAANQFRRFGWLTTAAAAVGLIFYVASFGSRSERAGGPPIPVDEVASTDVTPASNPGVEGPAAVATSPGANPLQVEIVANGPCWLAVSVDGERLFARLLQPGERHTLSAEHETVMRIGDPGALALSINGQRARPLGAPGQPVNVTITTENFREFLPS